MYAPLHMTEPSSTSCSRVERQKISISPSTTPQSCGLQESDCFFSNFSFVGKDPDALSSGSTDPMHGIFTLICPSTACVVPQISSLAGQPAQGDAGRQ